MYKYIIQSIQKPSCGQLPTGIVLRRSASGTVLIDTQDAKEHPAVARHDSYLAK